MKENQKKTDRIKVSRLVYMVLAETLSVKNALLKFPSDNDDTTIKAAYHALVHQEADEDLRRRDLAYREEQDSYLELIAQTLQKGEDLPKNIIKNYDKYYKSATTPTSKGMKGLIKSLCKFLNV